jgi:hypothetical protein
MALLKHLIERFGSRARGIWKDVLGAMRNDDQVAGLQQLRPAHYCRPTVWRNNND